MNANPYLPQSPQGGTVIIIQGKMGNQALVIDEGAFALNCSTEKGKTFVQVIDLKERIVFHASLTSLERGSINGLLPGQYKLRLVTNNCITEQGFWVNNNQ